MRVLVACEFSGVVRDAFRVLGHDAWSCDLLPCEGNPRWHIRDDVLRLLARVPQWDLMIAHPPCTHLAVSGARWFKDKQHEQQEALAFVRHLMRVPIPRICIENPVSVISSRIRKPDQTIQPWMFGHPETKATCLWLKNLPKLVQTNNVKAEMEALTKRERSRVHYASPGPDRWKERSRTLPGIAQAMAAQWGERGSGACRVIHDDGACRNCGEKKCEHDIGPRGHIYCRLGTPHLRPGWRSTNVYLPSEEAA